MAVDNLKNEGAGEPVLLLEDFVKSLGFKILYQVNPDGTRIDYEGEDD